MARTNEEEKAAVEVGVMMTEALEEGGEDSSNGLSKCFVNLPMKWSADNLRMFLKDQVGHYCIVLCDSVNGILELKLMAAVVNFLWVALLDNQ